MLMNFYACLMVGLGLINLLGSFRASDHEIDVIKFLSKSDSYHAPDSIIETQRIVFYNCENLFHPTNDSLTQDDDFTPSGDYHWTFKRYSEKINKIGKLFIAIGEGRLPALIGLCEVENRHVLEDLTQKTILRRSNYRIIHKDSPDARGIDVALLYDRVLFKPVIYNSIPVNSKSMRELITREILYVMGYVMDSIPLHVFINHWPSRRGGKLASDKRRMHVASVLRELVDSCYYHDPKANVLIMGDFNDEPTDQSLFEILKAKDPDQYSKNPDMYNLMFESHRSGEGTHFRKNNFYEASVLDQILVSSTLYHGFNRLKIYKKEAHIYKNTFLLDEKNGRPLRTYQGLKYLGGFSDHLPIYTDLQIVN